MEGQPLDSCEFHAGELLLRLETTVRADHAEAEALVDRIMETVTGMGCAAGKEWEIRLALEEALLNAIEHGCGGDPAKEVQCSVLCDQERGMLIVVRDPGPGFDPASVPSPIVGQNLYAARGRGIYLINQLVDQVRFERGGTEIHMRIK